MCEYIRAKTVDKKEKLAAARAFATIDRIVRGC
jgi:hypothetical protein